MKQNENKIEVTEAINLKPQYEDFKNKSYQAYFVDVECLILRNTFEELERPLNNIESNIPKQPDYTNYKCNKTQNLKNQKFNSQRIKIYKKPEFATI